MKKIFAPETIDISEDEAASFFEKCDNDGFELIYWPIEVSSVLTDEDEVYNEELLAKLRKLFLEAANHNAKIAIKPVYQNISVDLVTASMKHTARRLKKCDAIVGFVIPENSEFKDAKARQFFIDELLLKHEHYKFF